MEDSSDMPPQLNNRRIAVRFTRLFIHLSGE
jgi:hypothetical protein